MTAWSSMMREPVVLIAILSALLTIITALIFDYSGGVPQEPLVAPTPMTIFPATPTPQKARAALGFQALQDPDPSAPWPKDGRETLLTFVHISDTHVGHESDHENLARAIKVINAMEPAPAFVVISGDLTDHFTPDEIQLFKSVLSKLQPKVLLVPGNHDVMFEPNSKRLAWWNQEFPDFQTPYRFDHGPITIIGVDSQLWNARRRSRELDQVAAEQWARMEALIADARDAGQRVMILNHIPAVPTFYPGRLTQSWTTPRMRAYLEMLDRHGVEAEISGHVHRDELYAHNNTLFLTAPPISQKYTRLASVRLMRVTPDGLMYRQHYIFPAGQHLSYLMDLHHVDEQAVQRWIDGMNEDGLAELWRARYAGDAMTEQWFPKLDHQKLRDYLKAPFEHQPIGRFVESLRGNRDDRRTAPAVGDQGE